MHELPIFGNRDGSDPNPVEARLAAFGTADGDRFERSTSCDLYCAREGFPPNVEDIAARRCGGGTLFKLHFVVAGFIDFHQPAYLIENSEPVGDDSIFDQQGPWSEERLGSRQGT